ncbi:NADH dehydrogenase [ubiquinone] 1 alpha subcomplex subunit 5 [Nymphon striatum]|nr:NADH dehydrogenase [ubiquinone] 1 alpha subcomplex subunit 5 [Nymphon striatum]
MIIHNVRKNEEWEIHPEENLFQSMKDEIHNGSTQLSWILSKVLKLLLLAMKLAFSSGDILIWRNQIIPTVENKINSGTMEELIVQAENELLLSRKIIAWKAWEPLSQQPPLNQWKWPL